MEAERAVLSGVDSKPLSHIVDVMFVEVAQNRVPAVIDALKSSHNSRNLITGQQNFSGAETAQLVIDAVGR